MRFWICGKCGGECRSRIHPGYVRKSKLQDLETGNALDEKAGEEAPRSRWSMIFRIPR